MTMKKIAATIALALGFALPVRPAHAVLPFSAPPVAMQPWDDNNGETRWGYRAFLENGVVIEVGFLPAFNWTWFTWGVGSTAEFQTMLARLEAARASCIDSCIGDTAFDHFYCYRTTVFRPHFVTQPIDPVEKPVTAAGTYLHVSDPVLSATGCADVFKDRIGEAQDAMTDYYLTVTWH